MKLIKYSVNNSVSVNLIMLSIFFVGILLYQTKIPKDLFPAFSNNQVLVTTVYPGVSAKEMENNVTMKIEEAIHDIDYIDRIFSTSQEGLSTVMTDISEDASSVAEVINNIRQAIDRIEEFPEDAEDPEIKEVVTNYPIITVSLYGNVNLLKLKSIVEDLKDEISSISGVSEVKVSGLPEREIWIEIDPVALERYGLTFSEVSKLIGSTNFDLPAGTLQTGEGEFLIRTTGKATESSDLNNFIVKSTPGGGRILLGQIATVRNWFERDTSLGRFNMARAINLNITKTKSGDAVRLVEKVRELISKYEAKLPPTVKIGVFNDLSSYIKNRFKILSTSGLQGLSVVFCLLFLMLNLRVSLMVSLGIPISFLGAMILMAGNDMTMNMIAMFAFIVVLGMVVDDAVVIGENIYRHYENGLSPKEAAVRGTEEMAGPVISAVLTTGAAFLPLLLIPGKMGKFLGVIPMVVIFALISSLLEALVILPSHMNDFLPKKIPKHSPVREKFDKLFREKVEQYSKLLAIILKWRYVSFIAILAITVVIVLFGFFHVPMVLFHDFEGNQLFVNIDMPVSYSIEETEAYVTNIEKAVKEAVSGDLNSLVTNVGYIFNDFENLRIGLNLAQIIVEVKELGEGRSRTLKSISNTIREALDPFRKEALIQMKSVSAGPSSHPISIQITGDDPLILKAISGEVESYIRKFPGVFDLRDNFEAGKEEIKIKLKPHAYNLGLTDQQVALELRNAFWGAGSSKFRARSEEIDIVVKMPEGLKKSLTAINMYKITLPNGSRVPLSEIAHISKTKGVSQIIRENRRRSITVYGDLDQTVTTSKDITMKVMDKFSDLSDTYPGYSLGSGEGEMKDMERSMAGLKTAFVIGLLIIYFILGTQFKSYIQPFIVMSAIPFGINGVIVGHAILGKSLGLLSLIGLVALSGIVVNDSLILVDFVNKLRSSGTRGIESIIEAAKYRVRPVILTSVTTMGGLFMLVFFPKGQAKFLSPMAISIFWGLLFSTVIILIIVPCLYAIVDDLRGGHKVNQVS